MLSASLLKSLPSTFCDSKRQALLTVYRLPIFFILLASCLLLITFPVHAQITTGNTLSINNYKAPQNTDYSFMNLEHSLSCEGVGVGLAPNQPCLAYAPNGVLQAFAITPSGGAIGGLNNAMVAMYSTPPASVTEYVAYLGTNMGLVPKAYAQVAGSGSGVIQPVFALWQIIRDVSYLGFILVFIVIGFMIMFRQKLNPQTVITVQSALPGLVIGLILVTFSYFIAALLIDVSFFVVQIIGSLFQQVGNNGLGGTDDIKNITQNGNVLSLFILFVLNWHTLTSVATPIGNAFAGTSGGITLQGLIVTILTFGANLALGVVVGGLVMAILIIASIIQLVRLVWALLQAYISIFVNTILGPIFILYSTLPGRRGALTFWWKNILGNALIFPAVFAAFLFAGFIIGPSSGGTNAGDFGSSLPLLAFPNGLLRGILAFGIVLGTPAIPKMVKQAIGVKDLGEIATAAIAGAGAGYSTIVAGHQAGFKQTSNYFGLSARKKHLETTAAADMAAHPVRDTAAKWFG